MVMTDAEKMAEYRKRKAEDGVRISIWITRKAAGNLAALAVKGNTSREKIVSRLLEDAR